MHYLRSAPTILLILSTACSSFSETDTSFVAAQSVEDVRNVLNHHVELTIKYLESPKFLPTGYIPCCSDTASMGFEPVTGYGSRDYLGGGNYRDPDMRALILADTVPFVNDTLLAGLTTVKASTPEEMQANFPDLWQTHYGLRLSDAIIATGTHTDGQPKILWMAWNPVFSDESYRDFGWTRKETPTLFAAMTGQNGPLSVKRDPTDTPSPHKRVHFETILMRGHWEDAQRR